MSENLIYADLNLTETTRPRRQNVSDEGSAYAEVKVRSLDAHSAAGCTTSDPCCHTDTINFTDSRRGKVCCSIKLVAVSVVVMLLLLISAGCLMLLYRRTAGSSLDGETSPTSYGEAPAGCLQNWKEKGGKCYFFSPKQDLIDWNTSRKECNDMGSELVVTDGQEEQDYLVSQSRGSYYFLGLTYSKSENKWKWINNKEYMFVNPQHFPDYLCAVIGPHGVETASCSGSSTTKFMCEKAAGAMLSRRRLVSYDSDGDLRSFDSSFQFCTTLRDTSPLAEICQRLIDQQQDFTVQSRLLHFFNNFTTGYKERLSESLAGSLIATST